MPITPSFQNNPMKNAFRCLFITLVFATTGLFAEAATEPATTNDQTQQQPGKVAKKKHRKHKKKARR